MRPDKAKLAFRKLLKERDLSVRHLPVREGVDAALAFYETVRLSHAARDGDACAYRCSMPHRRNSARFELTLFRLFRTDDDVFPPSRLRLSFCFDWVQVLRWLGPSCVGLPDSSFCIRHPYDLPKLRQALQGDPVYQAALDKPAKAVELAYEEIFSIRG